MNSDPSVTVAVVVKKVNHGRVIDPFAPVQRRGGEPGDHALTPSPQPSGPGAQSGRHFCIPTDVHVAEKSGVTSAQLASSQSASGNGFTAKERLPHDGSVA